MQSSFLQSREHQIFFILSGIFIVNAVVAELIGAKIFSLEQFLNVPPAQLTPIEGFTLNFDMSVGVIIWPVVFIISDLINEYFGREGVKKISYTTVGLIVYMFVIVFCATKLPPADFWLNNNATDAKGAAFNIDFAYTKIFTQGLNIIIASIIAFLVGQLVDAYTFHWLRIFTQNKRKWLRATGSTIISQFFDSFVILTIAFYFLGNWSMQQVIAVGIVQYTYKLTMAIALTPVIYFCNNLIRRYLGEEKADSLVEKATFGGQA